MDFFIFQIFFFLLIFIFFFFYISFFILSQRMFPPVALAMPFFLLFTWVRL